MAPERPGASEPEWTAWRPENLGPACPETENRVLVNPWPEIPVAEMECSPQTNQGRLEGFHRVFESDLEHLAGHWCLAHPLFRHKWLVAKHKVANDLHVPFELRHLRHGEALRLLDS